MAATQLSDSTARNYPMCLVNPKINSYILKKYHERLNVESDRLFENLETDIKLHMLKSEIFATGAKFESVKVNNSNSLSQELRRSCTNHGRDAMWRISFWEPPNSRSKIPINKDMFTSLMTWHQVMPTFLDFVFPFGEQIYSENSHFAGFRYRMCMNLLSRSLVSDQLKRSGLEYQQCYNLKTIEFTDDEEARWPWNIRQASTFHSYDIVEGRASWIVLSPREKMRERIGSALEEEETPTCPASSFARSLNTHLVLCEWAGENWRWYIAYMEKRIRPRVHKCLNHEVHKKPSASRLVALAPRSTAFYTRTDTGENIPEVPEKRMFEKMKEAFGFSQAVLPDKAAEEGNAPPNKAPASPIEVVEDRFSFDDIQDIQHMENQGGEARSVLKANVSVLVGMKDHYEALWQHDDFPDKIKKTCRAEYAEFQSRLKTITDDLRMNLELMESLIRRLSDTKGLLNGILSFQNMETSRRLAEHARTSAEKTEGFTRAMHAIAVKTEKETVAMRVITLVTLFFLPGTFISVSVLIYGFVAWRALLTKLSQTLMSANIVSFAAGSTNLTDNGFSSGALKLFFVLALPLMVVTLGSYGIWLWWIKIRRESNQEFDKKYLTRTGSVYGEFLTRK